jgi:cation diffusion facilitator CzcD-associated flavoprotein CzcO
VVGQYLEDYCDRFDLRPLVYFHHEVTSIGPLDPGSRFSSWHVVATNTDTGNTVEADYDLVVVASGKEWQPRFPAIKNREIFRGNQLHSMDYRKDETFQDKYGEKNVLVVGASASGIDIAEEVSAVAKIVYVR